jgi:hypothetical protein
MSARRIPRRTAVLIAAATGLIGLAGPAAADPPAVDFDPCANTLNHVTQWPGELGDGSTHYSDGFESSLLRLPACQPIR